MRAVLFSLVVISSILLLPGCSSCGHKQGNVDPDERGGVAKKGNNNPDNQPAVAKNDMNPGDKGLVAQASPANSNTQSMQPSGTPYQLDTAVEQSAEASEMVLSTNDGVQTVTRIFKNNPRISKTVVITTPNGKKTAKVYLCNGKVQDLPDGFASRALTEESGVIANAADPRSSSELMMENKERATMRAKKAASTYKKAAPGIEKAAPMKERKKG